MAIGLSCFIFIFLFIKDELSYDKNFKNYKRIYRLESDITISDNNQKVAKSSFALAPAMKKEFPEIEAIARFRSVDNGFLQYQDKLFFEDQLYFADSTVFDVFDHPFIYGGPENALTKPNSIVLDKTTAEKYFGDKNPLGEVVKLNNKINCSVTGVIADLPANVHLRFHGLVSIETYSQIIGDRMYRDLNNVHFWAIRLFSYILIHKNSSIDEIHQKFQPFHNKYIEPVSKRLNGKFNLMTTRLDKIHLYSGLDWDLPRGDFNTILIFSIIATFILLIAGINYMNLATARSSHRAKEVGIKKVLGAHKGILRRGFLGESVIIAMAAFIVAVVIIEIFLPAFNHFTGKNISFQLPKDAVIYLILLIITAGIGLIAGSYPALYLSAFKPVVVLKGMINPGRKSGHLRKLLIIFQFTVATIMIACTIAVTRQLNYVKNQDLGFNKDNVIIIRATDTTFKKKLPDFKNEILKDPNIFNIATSNTLPGEGGLLDVFLVEGDEKFEEHLMNLIFVDYNFIDLMGMELINGRNFNKNYGTDKEQGVIINWEAAKMLGWNENALGKEIRRRTTERTYNHEVIGVVKNFNFNSLYDEISPIVFFLEDKPSDLITLRINPNNMEKTLAGIEKVWTRLNPGEPFKYDYLSELLNLNYDADNKLQKIIGFFALISVFISLLGLFGLSSFIAEQFSKNIGIRKLLGATVGSLVYMLSKDFIRLILIAFIIAVPIAWYFLEQWLDHFAYRISININWFIITGVIILMLAQITVIIQTINAALTNPVDAIKYE
ncbi:MAG: ABC transporter permease [Bacteroidetes bacterium]|nr:ABC transporter permease [Bacteroidota bacterium]